MNKLLQHRYTLRENFFTLVGVCLCFYFAYHAFFGSRSVLQLISLNRNIETMSLQADFASAERIALEKKVAMMRPGSLSKDLLEERARMVLGYKGDGEIAILSN
jgi:cell division protein FtsB